jgi:hypothetical protein
VGRLPHLHPFLRRWDHREGPRRKGRTNSLKGGAVPLAEGRWLPLEDGVQVYFAENGTYRTGDHWLIPARTATGSVEWDTDAARRPLLKAPAGIDRHLAPLALVTGEGSTADLRQAFGALATDIPSADQAALDAEARAAHEERTAEAGPSQGRSQTTAAAGAAAEGDE